MSDTISPPPGFSMVDQPTQQPQRQASVSPPPGFSMVQQSQPQLRSGVSSGSPRSSGMAEILVRPPPEEMAPIVEDAANKYGVPLKVAHFVGSTESHWDPQAVGPQTSSGRATGAWQFMPDTAQRFGIDPGNFSQSTDAAMKYLRQLADQNGGDWERAIQSYGTFSTGRGAQADESVRNAFRSYMGNETPMGEDIAHGFGRGLMEGAGSILGMPADIWHLIDRGYQQALTHGAQLMGLLTPEQAEQLRAPIPGGEDSSFGSEAINNHLLKLAKSAGADTSEPYTKPGQYAETVSSFLPAAGMMAAPGTGLAGAGRAALKYGAAPGVASETAGQLTKDTSAEPFARVAGAVAGAGPLAALEMATKTPNKPLAEALRGVTPQQFSTAQTLLNDSRAAGAPLTLPEALQHATNGATRLGDIQRVVEQSRAGAPAMRSMMADRPAQTEALGRDMLDQVSAAPPDPEAVSGQVQQSADARMAQEAQARTAAVEPHYQAAAADTVPAADMEGFLSHIDKMIASDKTGILAPRLGALRDALTEKAATDTAPRVPVTDIENLDRARKYFRDKMQLPQWAQEAIPKEEGAKIGGLLDDLRGMMTAHSPDFAAGKQLYQTISKTKFEPLERSPIGRLAGTDSFEKQTSILFNPNPLPGSERAVGQAVRDIARVDPESAQHFVRLYLERTFNEATQNNLSGPNPMGGAKFVSVVAGNPQQAKNLQAAVRALPNGDVRWGALQKGMDIMAAQGRRQPVGSATEFNRMLNVELRQGAPIGEVAAAAASPARLMSWAGKIYENFQYNRNTGELARLFTTGDINDLRQVASSLPRTLRGQAALIGALVHQGSTVSGEPNQQGVPALQ